MVADVFEEDIFAEDIFAGLDTTAVKDDLSDRVEQFRLTLIKKQLEQAAGQPSDEYLAAQAMLEDIKHSIRNLHTLNEPLTAASAYEDIATKSKNFVAEYNQLIPENINQEIESFAKYSQGWAEFFRGGYSILNNPIKKNPEQLEHWLFGLSKMAEAIDIYWRGIPTSIMPKLEILAEKILKIASQLKGDKIKFSAESLKYIAGFILFRIQQEKQKTDRSAAIRRMRSLLKTEQPAPTDVEVAAMLEERRMEKYLR